VQQPEVYTATTVMRAVRPSTIHGHLAHGIGMLQKVPYIDRLVMSLTAPARARRRSDSPGEDRSFITRRSRRWLKHWRIQLFRPERDDGLDARGAPRRYERRQCRNHDHGADGRGDRRHAAAR
jgi:hypothetical protein